MRLQHILGQLSTWQMRLTHVARPLILVLRALPVVVKKGEKGRGSILEPPRFASNFGRVLRCFLSALPPLQPPSLPLIF
jgi:hypothetical protein